MSLREDGLTDHLKSSGTMRSQNLDRAHVRGVLTDRQIEKYRKQGRYGRPWWSCNGRFASFVEYKAAKARKGASL